MIYVDGKEGHIGATNAIYVVVTSSYCSLHEISINFSLDTEISEKQQRFTRNLPHIRIVIDSLAEMSLHDDMLSFQHYNYLDNKR